MPVCYGIIELPTICNVCALIGLANWVFWGMDWYGKSWISNLLRSLITAFSRGIPDANEEVMKSWHVGVEHYEILTCSTELRIG